MREPAPLSSMTVDLDVGCGVVVDERLSITLLQKSGRKARIRIVAPREAVIEQWREGDCLSKPSMAT